MIKHALLTLLSLVLAVLTSGCAHASRTDARAAVEVAARAVFVADQACAEHALNRADLPLAKACEKAYGRSRNVLILAASEVDSWDDKDGLQRGRLVCHVVHVAEQLAAYVKEFESRKIAVPSVVLDALALARLLGSCSELTP